MHITDSALARALNNIAPRSARQDRAARPASRGTRRLLAVGATVAAVGLFGAIALPAQADTLSGDTSLSTPATPATPAVPAAPATPASPAAPGTGEAVPAAPAAPAAAKPKKAKKKHTAVSMPVKKGTRISSKYGYRHAPCWGCSSFHKGLDFNPGYGKPVRAIADGVVTVANSRGEFGVHASVKHKVDGKVVTSGYAHMQYGSMHLRVGQKVKRGQIIGRVGTTGMSTGAHLHFTLKSGGGKLINPLTWLKKHVNR